jgi:hypothetical protein
MNRLSPVRRFSRVTLCIAASAAAVFAMAIDVSQPAAEAQSQVAAENPTVEENRQPGSTAYSDQTAPLRLGSELAHEEQAPPSDTEAAVIALNPNAFSTQSTPNLRGYAARESVNRGESIGLNISSATAAYVVSVYRAGWYGGTGARLYTETTMNNGVLRSVPNPDINGKVDVNWPTSLVLDTSSYPSGAYMVVLSTVGATRASGLIPFIVREDSRVADVLFQIPTQTWQAYDNFGGKSTYPINSTNGQRAYKVSLNRPYEAGGGEGQFAGVYNAIKFLEREGYNVTYAASSDLDRDANIMANHKVLLSVYHDEYWTGQMFTNLQSWLRQGKHFMSLSANSIYWQTRYEDDRRTLVVYKDAALDPVADPRQKTVLFRSPTVDRPESELFGGMYESSFDYGRSADWVVKNPNHWIYAGTGFVDGSRIKSLVGYEWDRLFDVFLRQAFNPRLDLTGVTMLSDSPVYTVTASKDDPNRQQATVKEMSSGAIIFNPGTNYWPLLLIGTPQYALTVDPTTVTAVERITKNALNRMIGTVPTPVSSGPGTVVPLASTRMADTLGGPTIDGSTGGGALAPWVSREVQIGGRGGVPSNARAAVVTVTLSPSASGWAVVFGCGALPNSSNLNFTANTTVTSTMLVPLSASGTVCVNSVAAAQFKLDVSGFVPASSSISVNAPSRLFDSRVGAPLEAGTVKSVAVLGNGGLPASAAGVFLNLTAVTPASGGWLTAYACDGALPNTSNVNFVAGQTVPNTVFVALGVSGTVCVRTSARTHIIVDALGAVPSGPGFVSGISARLVDTRIGFTTIDGRFASTGALRGGSNLGFEVGSRGAAPGQAAGVVALNITVVNPQSAGTVSVGWCGGGQVTVLSFNAGAVLAGFAMVKPDPLGNLCVSSTATTEVLVDRLGTIPAGT